MNEKELLISFKNINKRFSKNTILYNLNLDIYKNEILAIIGQSGCGKSTFLKILIGFYSIDSGEILYNNTNIYKNYDKIKKVIGYVSQENSFYEKLTILENLTFFAKIYNVKKSDIKYRISFLLNLVKLEHVKNTLASNISGGMKRRLEFAISLIHNPAILILDEPFTGLDAKIRDELWNVVNKIKNLGVTIIISTHLLNSAQKHCDRIVVLHNQNIIQDINKENFNFDLENWFLEVIKR